MSLSAENWRNKNGTGIRNCKCGTWKDHWLKYSGKAWPSECSVVGCNAKPTLGAHVYHASVEGERIAPLCDSCNKLSGYFNLKGSVQLPSANQKETCDK